MGNFVKPYEELLFTDNFMFVKTMEMYPEYCKEMLELLLSVKIDKIESISTEQSIENTFESKGVRLDVIMKDSDGNIYDAEMQVVIEPDLPKRARYYHSAIDTDFLMKGSSYDKLKPVYVVFICVEKLNYAHQAPVYFFQNIDLDTKVLLHDQSYTVMVNSDYINSNPDDDTLSEELREFLNLVNHGKTNSFNNTLARRIEILIEKLKNDREWRPKYMTLYEEMQIEGRKKFEEGREEGKIQACIELYLDDVLTPEKAAELLGITVYDFNEKIEEYSSANKHQPNRTINT